jgi:hypothetical protein
MGGTTRLAGVLALALGAVLTPAAGASPAARPVTTIAIVGDSAINPLHADFRTRDGRAPRYPAGMPAPVVVPVPRGMSFADAMDRLAEGPLGHPKAGTLYALQGTRLLIYATPGQSGFLAPGDNRLHGTGAASSAAGRVTGTSPDSLVVFVPGMTAPGYGWIARQQWIDVASTSVYAVRTTDQCAGAAEVREQYRAGGLLFSSSGNTADWAEPVSIPNGLPEVYQVGGVDGTGRSWLPPHPAEPSPFFAAGTVVRPYESGARFSFQAATGDGITGTQPFGGTSGATPTVAGYAAELVAEARRILHSGGRRGAVLAALGPGGARPRSGPLADGTLTRDELVAVLHATATPYETAGPQRYEIEGYGATTAASHALALRVLRGQSVLPSRPDEDAANARAESVRAALAGRC